MLRTILRALCSGFFLFPVLSCGDGEDQSRPIEILYFVQGPSGAAFEFAGPTDNADCFAVSTERPGALVPSGGYGIQSLDAVHVPTASAGAFTAPHYFVLENERQETRAVLRNLGATPITVLRLLGAGEGSALLTSHIIPAGACRSISTLTDAREANRLIGAAPDPDNEFRIEVCSFLEGVELPDGFHCQDIAPRGGTDRDAEDNPLVDTGAFFLSTVGDFTASFLSQCLSIDLSQRTACLTPSTFYMHAPIDQVSAAMTRLTGQERSFLQVDLYRGANRVDTDRGTVDTTVREDI